MTQKLEQLSALVDGEHQDAHLLDEIKSDKIMAEKWQRYHLIRQTMRKELPNSVDFDIAAKVSAALEQEPVVLAPKSGWRQLPGVAAVLPLVRQGGQLAIAASVAVAVVIGVQTNNQPEEIQPFSAEQPILQPLGALSPVSLEQTRPISRANTIEQRRLIEAYLNDHKQQVRLKVLPGQQDDKQSLEQEEAKELDQ